MLLRCELFFGCVTNAGNIHLRCTCLAYPYEVVPTMGVGAVSFDVRWTATKGMPLFRFTGLSLFLSS